MAEQLPCPLLACVPEGAPGYTPGPDYRLLPCQRCGWPCWVGPTQRALRSAGMACWCMVCALLVGGPDVPRQTLSATDTGARFDPSRWPDGL